jgi:hypothetical protein
MLKWPDVGMAFVVIFGMAAVFWVLAAHAPKVNLSPCECDIRAIGAVSPKVDGSGAATRTPRVGGHPEYGTHRSGPPGATGPPAIVEDSGATIPTRDIPPP